MKIDKESLKLMRCNALQSKEIEEHRYFLSQESGKDVGVLAALHDWTKTPIDKEGTTHASKFRKTYMDHEQRVQESCNERCGYDECKGARECNLPKGRLHEILED